MTVEEFLKQYAAGVRNFASINLSEANLSGVNLSGVNLSGVNLSVANLSGANLSGANLSGAKLNVAKLSGANLSGANLSGAILNVANLVRADLREAELMGASLIRAELIRADLGGANLSGANLTGADLGEATLRTANLRGANLSEANLRGALLTAASLQEANLHGAELNRADLGAADLRGTELRQVNLGLANLSGADLSGSNLRWADLSGVNLSWANLSEAKLSGANLSGADLSHANLLNASLVHADLSSANLIKADWAGADLTCATITGAKLYAASRFGLKTEGLICEWVDLSPDGDRSQIYRFSKGEAKKFFLQTLPTVRIIVDGPLDQDANLALAFTYHQLAVAYPVISRPPSIEVSDRRTTLTFKIDNDELLFATAYLAIFPFQDAAIAQKNLLTLSQVKAEEESIGIQEQYWLEKIAIALEQVVKILEKVKTEEGLTKARKENFFQTPTQIILTNSSEQALNIYAHPSFGKRLSGSVALIAYPQENAIKPQKNPRLTTPGLLNFLSSFH
ncbi:pentapeptide repeat-containing protein [Microseira wollei]|uniref:Pentapeptide repeat-containing protein n=1 Tax=Microseira wollei NIES-4236 TaxID=2530354 RepID=A0AAV3XAZ5_9CYAN|nr:pentapeptide repeat-containing protein [Microseira wollei]GET39638.1 pentapeptide repeat-containing protein [Microseira wollei NIES-4236]